MHVEKLAQIVGENNVDTVVADLDAHMGPVSDLEVATGGLVHHVFRVSSESSSAYLKIRGNFYAGIPGIQTQPELIDNEKTAIQLLAAKTPEYFPSIIAHDSNMHYLLLSDVMPNGATVDKKYEQGLVTTDDLHQFGRALGDIHTRHTSTHDSVRLPDDTSYQSNLLKYTLEFYEHPALMEAAYEHKHRSTQLLVGDLSPKNAYIEDGIVRLCDLENAHQGALPYDQAFALAHVLLHQKAENLAVNAMRAFLDGYNELGPDIDQSDSLLAMTLHGILLYRLDNPIIPYNLPFSADRRRRMSLNVFESLDQCTQSLEEITANLFRGQS